MSEWISVKDRLPVPDTFVIWAVKKGLSLPRVAEGYYDPSLYDGRQLWRQTRTPRIVRSIDEVTHWMPLPKPPEDER